MVTAVTILSGGEVPLQNIDRSINYASNGYFQTVITKASLSLVWFGNFQVVLSSPRPVEIYNEYEGLSAGECVIGANSYTHNLTMIVKHYTQYLPSTGELASLPITREYTILGHHQFSEPQISFAAEHKVVMYKWSSMWS